MRIVTLLLLALVALVPGFTLAAPAYADGDALQLSTDGRTWSDNITEPLFDPAVRWVPGDERTVGFYVRNTRPDDGDLSLVLRRGGTGKLYDSGDLDLSARVDSGAWISIRPGDSRSLTGSSALGVDEAFVELRATMDAASLNQTMVLATDLDLDLRLTEQGVLEAGPLAPGGQSGTPLEPLSPTDPNATPHGVLPDTGSPLRPWLLPLALLLLGAGAVLVARRIDEDEDPA